MESPAAMLSKAVDCVEDALDLVQQSWKPLASIGQDTQPATCALEQAREILDQLERKYLESLGLPSNYARIARLRIDKELVSWKIWLPSLMFALLALTSFFVLFDASRWLELSIFLLVATPIAVLTAHEGLHALSFFLFGRNRPGFQLKLGFFRLGAFAAGNCLLSRMEYLIVVLTPLIGITLLGGILWALLPSWRPGLYLFMVVNAAGAVGDLWIASLLWRARPQALCLDTSYEIAIFEPTSG